MILLVCYWQNSSSLTWKRMRLFIVHEAHSSICKQSNVYLWQFRNNLWCKTVSIWRLFRNIYIFLKPSLTALTDVIVSIVVNRIYFHICFFLRELQNCFLIWFLVTPNKEEPLPTPTLPSEWELSGWYFLQWHYCLSHDREECRENGDIYLRDVMRQGHTCTEGGCNIH